MNQSFKKIRDGIAALAERALDLVFPPDLYCICCGNLIDGSRIYHLCDHCIRHIRWDHSPPSEKDGLMMMRCAAYGIYERTLIFSLKYSGNRYIVRDVAKMMGDRLKEAGITLDVIVPVPMSPEKEKARGFNHAERIAAYLAKETGTVNLGHVLRRTRETRPMRGLSPSERRENIRGCISLREGALSVIKGKRVLILDDFYTTGATAGECASAIWEAEPESVLFIAFAARYDQR